MHANSFIDCLCQETAQYLDKGFKLEGATNGLLMRISHVGVALPNGTLYDRLLEMFSVVNTLRKYRIINKNRYIKMIEKICILRIIVLISISYPKNILYIDSWKNLDWNLFAPKA